MSPSTLKDLEVELIKLSQSDEAVEAIEKFSQGLNKTAQRIQVFNAEGALLRAPILYEEAGSLGFNQPDDNFVLLQGDIVSTDSAYFLGARVTGGAKFAVLNSSCDLIPQRRQCAALLRVIELRKSEPNVGEKLNLLLRFKRKESMYLPPLSMDAEDVVANVVQFDGICQIESGNLLLSNRIASLSVVGWRMFASFARMVIGRANPRESQMRSAIENRPTQLDLPEPNK